MKRIIQISILILLAFNSLKSQNQVASSSNELPIDGVWMEYASVFGGLWKNGNYIRISNGQLLYEKGNFLSDLAASSGDILARNIKQVGKRQFVGNLLGKPDVSVEFFLVKSDLHMFIDREKKHGILYHNSRKLINHSLDNIDLYNHHYNKSKFQTEVKIMEEITVVGDQQVQKISPGVTMSIQKSHTLSKEVEFSSNYSNLESRKKIHKIGAFGLGRSTEKIINTQLEKRVTNAIKNEEKMTATISLDGNVSSQWKITWYDRFKTGKIIFRTSNNQMKYLYFRIPLSSEIVVEPIN